VLTIYDNDPASEPFYITNIGSANPVNGKAPTAYITTPINGSQYAYPASITLTAYASCAINSTLAAVTFYTTAPPATFKSPRFRPRQAKQTCSGMATWTASSGTYSLIAIAVDSSV